MNRPLRNWDLGSSTAVSGHWLGDPPPPVPARPLAPMRLPDASLTRASQDMAAMAFEGGILIVDHSRTHTSFDEAAFSFVPPKSEKRLRVVTHNLGRGVVIVDD